MTVCGDCGGTAIEYDVAAGNGFCVKCGTIIEENTIVSEVTFGESSSGAAIVQGSYVGQGATRARMGGPFGNRGSSESREQTLANASRKIRNVAGVLRLSEVVQASAIRIYTLAVEHKFTKGRKNMNVIAVCLYVACRQKETRNYMLIDFSDLLQVNVFELGHTYLQLVHTLNLRLPLVDPSHYISRFAALLEFGDETSRVAADAVRLVARMDRDWMSRGRRPAGICGACLLLAARMNNFRRSVEEIVQVVKIADATVKKRLDEFKKTPSGQLTLADFRTVWLEDEMDPPAFTRGRERELREAEKGEDADEEDESEAEGRRKGKKKKRKKRKRDELEGGREGSSEGVNGAAAAVQLSTRQPIDPQLFNEGILADATDVPLFLPDPDDDDRPSNIDPALLTGEASQSLTISREGLQNLESEPSNPVDEALDTVLAKEVSEFLTGSQGARLASALDEAQERRLAGLITDDELLGLDEAELDAFILSEEEVRIKERVWVEINRDYLEKLAVKEALKAGTETPKSRKKRKTPAKPRDASTPSGSTPGESVRNLINKNRKYSKRINYDALKNLFDGAGAAAEGSSILDPGREINLDEKEDSLYRLDENEKSDGEGMVVIEESGGGVGMVQAASSARDGSAAKHPGPDSEGTGPGDDTEAMDDDAGIELSDKGDDYGWDDVYEQEV